MPPIDLARLRPRIAALAEGFDDPAATAQGVRRLLDDYADRTHRPSARVASRSLGYSFKVSPPVLRPFCTVRLVKVRGVPKLSQQSGVSREIFATSSTTDRPSRSPFYTRAGCSGV